MKFIIFDFRKYLNLGDAITVIDLAEKYYRLTGKKPYIIARGLNKNKTVREIITEYPFINFIHMNILSGFLKVIFILLKSIFIRYTYCISITKNKIKEMLLFFLYYFTRANLLLYSFSVEYYKDKVDFLKEGKNTKIVLNSETSFLDLNNILLSSYFNEEINIKQNFLFKKNSFPSENDLGKDDYIGLALGASNLGKSIKVDDFLYIAKSFWNKYKKSFVFLGIGSKYELLVAEQLILMFKENNIPYKNFLGEKDFSNTLNLLEGAFMNIGPNTGLILLSFYMDKKTIIFSENTSNFYTFKNENSIFFMNPKICSCEKILMNADKDITNINNVGCCLSMLDIKKEIDDFMLNLAN